MALGFEGDISFILLDSEHGSKGRYHLLSRGVGWGFSALVLLLLQAG